MLLVGESYSREFKSLAVADGDVDMAIAFWGKGADDLVQPTTSGKRRIICNLMSGGTNPHVIEKLMRQRGVEVKQLDTLHAKVLLGPAQGIIGSANFSANGLGFEGDEVGHWVEAGYLIRDPSHLEEARTWFEKHWDFADGITDQMIADAVGLWKQRQASRPKPKGDRFLINKDNWRAYLGRDVKLIIWRNRPTEEQNARSSEDKASRIAKMAQSTEHAQGPKLSLDYYHNWQNALHKDKAAAYIDVQFQKSGKVTCHGARRPLTNGGHVVVAGKGGGVMDVMEKINRLAGLAFEAKERDALAALIAPVLEDRFAQWSKDQNKGDSKAVGAVVTLDEVLESLFGSKDASVARENQLFDWLFRCGDVLAGKIGMRCVIVNTPQPQVRIGFGERNLAAKDSPALGRVSLKMRLSGGTVTCATFLSKKEAIGFGALMDHPDDKGRTWIQWPVEETGRVLPSLVIASTQAFIKRERVSPPEDFTRKWPAREALLTLKLPASPSPSPA